MSVFPRLSVRLLAGTACLLAAWAPATARADGPPVPAPAEAPAKVSPARTPVPPKYDVLRFREDWSSLRCTPPCERCDPSDRLKARPWAGAARS
jgi:hypothetical protein